MKKLGMFFLLITILFVTEVQAHPGRTDSNGCHTCRTNCTSWGLQTGEYHCHNGSTNSSSSVNTQTTVMNEVTKSSDNTLKSIVIDGKKMVVYDEINYTTKKEKIDINVETNDSKAKCTINNNELLIGKNIIDIEVIAEDGSVKNYKVNVTREKLSDNTNMEVIVAGEKIDFVNYIASTNVSSDTETLDYEYDLEDENAKVEITGSKKLKAGENLIKFKVTAEDGTEQIYELNVNKYTKSTEIMGSILSIAFLGGCGYGIYYLLKKRKRKVA